jgi:hypothetical protein
MDTQHVLGHAAWTWTHSIDMDMEHVADSWKGQESRTTPLNYIASLLKFCFISPEYFGKIYQNQMKHQIFWNEMKHKSWKLKFWWHFAGKPFMKQISTLLSVQMWKINPPLCTVYMFHHAPMSEMSPARLFWESGKGSFAEPNANVSGFRCYVLDIRSLVVEESLEERNRGGRHC